MAPLLARNAGSATWLQIERGVEVDFEHALPVGGAQRLEWPALDDAHVVAQTGQCPHDRKGPIDDSARAVECRHVTRDRVGGAASRNDAGARLLGPLGYEVVDHDTCTGHCDFVRDRGAYARAGTGHEHRPIAEREIGHRITALRSVAGRRRRSSSGALFATSIRATPVAAGASCRPADPRVAARPWCR